MHVDNEPGSRGGFSLYVPEYYTPDRALPAGDGPARRPGNGRASCGAGCATPGAAARSWSRRPHRRHLGAHGRRTDTPTSAHARWIRARWSVDPDRMLLTGMSDGGTFCYVSGLESLAIHPPGAGGGDLPSAVAEMADADGCGAADLSGARRARLDVPGADRAAAQRALTAAGARR